MMSTKSFLHLFTVVVATFLFVGSAQAAERGERQVGVCKDTYAILDEIDKSTVELALRIKEDCAGMEKDVHVLINSLGGGTGDGFSVYTTLKSIQPPTVIITETLGQAISSASVIFMAGTKRKISCHSIFIIHESHIEYSARIWHEVDFKESWERTQLINNIMADIYAKGTGKTRDEMRAMLKQRTVLNAQEALRLGFATEIIGDCGK